MESRARPVRLCLLSAAIPVLLVLCQLLYALFAGKDVLWIVFHEYYIVHISIFQGVLCGIAAWYGFRIGATSVLTWIVPVTLLALLLSLWLLSAAVEPFLLLGYGRKFPLLSAYFVIGTLHSFVLYTLVCRLCSRGGGSVLDE